MRTQREPDVLESVVEPDVKQDEPVKKVEDVPPKRVYNHDLKKIKSYRKLRRNFKINNSKIVFVNDMKAILECFKLEEHKLDTELLIEVLNVAESFFIYGSKQEREDCKLESVRELMLPYFFDNELILDKSIANVYHRVVKSNLVKRVYRRLLNFFFSKERV
tara:strand:- start:12 stop:497 length:486 start_codon:yes stop_codon:yes gene_type:complete